MEGSKISYQEKLIYKTKNIIDELKNVFKYKKTYDKKKYTRII